MKVNLHKDLGFSFLLAVSERQKKIQFSPYLFLKSLSAFNCQIEGKKANRGRNKLGSLT